MSRLKELNGVIREMRIARGWTQDELARRAGTTTATISKIERSHRALNLDWIERFATAFGMTSAEFLNGTPTKPIRVREIPILGHIAAGNWREAIAVAEGSVTVPDATENAFALRPVGDSMNLLIPDGALAIVEPDLLDLREGQIYAVMNGAGETTLKRYRNDPARLEPCSTNPEHKPLALGREPFTVIGRATGALLRF